MTEEESKDSKSSGKKIEANENYNPSGITKARNKDTTSDDSSEE